MNSNQVLFDPQLETIIEFIERFEVQNSDLLDKAGSDGVKKARVIIKCLPINIITNLQRKLTPTRLSEATYSMVTENLISQYHVKKSIVGASVRFINKKQAAGESIENYARILNTYASECHYKSCCMDRLLRDIFVAGIHDSNILSQLLHECDKDNNIKFETVVQKAKMIEQLKLDAQDIKQDETIVRSYKVNSNKISSSYKCIRCLTIGKHLAQNCFALKMTCNSCRKKGHLAKACISNKIRKVHEEDEDQTTVRDDASENGPAYVHSGIRTNVHAVGNSCTTTGRNSRTSAETHKECYVNRRSTAPTTTTANEDTYTCRNNDCDCNFLG